MAFYKELLVAPAQQHNLFLVRNKHQHLLGLRQRLHAQSRYSILEKAMLKGELIHCEEQAAQLRCVVRVPDDATWRDGLFHGDDIHFPWPPRDASGEEFICPESYWNSQAATPQRLNDQEAHFRAHTLEQLKTLVTPGCRIYDPACSTGEFISSLQHHFPQSRCIASDRSAAMVAETRRTIPDAVVGDVMTLPHPQPYDIVICRFINHEVMSSLAAQQVLRRMVEIVSETGQIILFGHTPVACDVPDFCHQQGLQLLGTIGRSSQPDGVFQYYRLAR